MIWQPPKSHLKAAWSNANKTTTAEVIFLALEIVSHNRPAHPPVHVKLPNIFPAAPTVYMGYIFMFPMSMSFGDPKFSFRFSKNAHSVHACVIKEFILEIAQSFPSIELCLVCFSQLSKEPRPSIVCTSTLYKDRLHITQADCVCV